ncbi:MAG: hypothetical protein IKC24_03765 [Oscillospiraceae bacterium]|nr:hypothetical protein [Oscillospiraceae bacterium]
MKKKQLAAKLLLPPFPLILLLVSISAAALICVFRSGLESTIPAYACYVLSFYTLCVTCVFCWKTLPRYWRSGKDRLYANRYASRYLTDTTYKTHVNLYRSLLFDLMYVGVNALSAHVYHTHWFALFAVYHGILAAMRFLLLRYMRKHTLGGDRLGELRRARLCACILLTVNLALSAAVLMMIYFHRGWEYRGVLIYAMALYTFYITTTAIIELVRFRKYKSPILSMTKIVKMASALVSMLLLETAMFAQFGGDMPAAHQRIMIMATGGGIAAVVVAMASYMIIRTTNEIRSLR